MWIFSLILILIFTYLFMKKYEMDYFEAVPLGLCSQLLFMYVLCFVRGLWVLDWIGLAVTLFFLIKIVVRKEFQTGTDFFKATIWNWKSFTLFLFIAIITILTFYKSVIWWDDINFWATDAKFYYYYGGFAPKYGNVAVEFGDYPPLLSMMKWLFLHANATVFQEGLIFSGYFSFLLILLLPLLAHAKKTSPLFLVVAFPVLFFSYSIFDGIYMEGCCADLVMGALYGNLLWTVWRERFRLLPFVIYGSALVLTKSVGIEWYVFTVFLAVSLKILQKNKGTVLDRIKWRKLLLIFFIPVLVEGSWLSFCLLNRRVAKLTGASVKYALKGELSFLKNAGEKAVIFLKGFFIYPMNGNENLGFALSSGIFLIFLIIIIILLSKKNIIISKDRKAEGNLLLIYTVVTALAAYGIIFLGHVTIFAGELQYQDPKIMAISIARYGSPFTVGMFIFLFHILFHFYHIDASEEQMKKKENFLLYLSFFFMTLFFCQSEDIKDTFLNIPNESSYQKNILDRQDMIEEEGQIYARACLLNRELAGNRVLYLRENETVHWVKDSYINYEVSPIATVYAGIDTEKMTAEELCQKIRESHASFLYCDDVKGDEAVLFTDLCKDHKFEAEHFYKIIDNGSDIELKKYE